MNAITCRKCGVPKRRILFYAHNLSWCMACFRAYNKIRRIPRGIGVLPRTLRNI